MTKVIPKTVRKDMTYLDAGVDVEAGDQLVEWLQKSATSHPKQSQVLGGIGGFAALFRLDLKGYQKPCLVSATDGVGTKIKLAADFAMVEGVGQDLVAMCVNDLICCGAEPLFFLDYYASGKLDLDAAKRFLQGVRNACAESGCVLIGGETAEMPGIYQASDFDAAGFAVGIVDEDRRLGPEKVQIGAHVIGVGSSGFHSNGYSLLRRLFAEDMEEWKDTLLRPTYLYPKLAAELRILPGVQAFAHITGGGMENIPRVMPLGSKLRLLDWAWPEEFLEVQDRSGLSREEMLKTFNCGIGFVIFVDPSDAAKVEEKIAKLGFQSQALGRVDRAIENAEPVVIY